MRNRVLPIGVCGNPMRSCAAATMNPEWTLSVGELMTACRAPSGSTVQAQAGGNWFGRFPPESLVCGGAGSFLGPSTVAPTWSAGGRSMKLITEHGCKEGDCVDLIGIDCPGDGVTGMNPNLVGQEGQSLACLIRALGTHGESPSLGLGGNRDD